MTTFCLNRCHYFTKKKFYTRVITESTGRDLANELEGLDWMREIGPLDNLDKYTRDFHERLMGAVDKHAPKKLRTVKSSDKPWIDENTLKMIRKRKRLFRTDGRGRRWKKLKAVTRRMVRKKKKKFHQKAAEDLAKVGSHQTPHWALNKLRVKESQSNFDLRELDPLLTEEQQREKLADFFSAISQEFVPLDETDIPALDPDMTFETITENEIISALVAMKKPKSSISIDPPSSLIAACARGVAQPMANIVNAIMSGSGWPDLWKEEEVTAIPKAAKPQSYDQLRNISCTSVFSKLAESFMLEGLQGEVQLRDNQYGSMRGSGTTHRCRN